MLYYIILQLYHIVSYYIRLYYITCRSADGYETWFLGVFTLRMGLFDGMIHSVTKVVHLALRALRISTSKRVPSTLRGEGGRTKTGRMGWYWLKWIDMEVSWNGVSPKSSHLSRMFHYKRSIWGTPVCGNTHMLCIFSPIADQADTGWSLIALE